MTVLASIPTHAGLELKTLRRVYWSRVRLFQLAWIKWQLTRGDRGGGWEVCFEVSNPMIINLSDWWELPETS